MPQLKILWRQERKGLAAQGKLQGLVPGNEKSRAEDIDIENVSRKYEGFFDKETEDAKEEALVLFPNQSWQSVVTIDLTGENNRQLWKSLLEGNVKLRITIRYRSFRRKHKTVQTLAFDELSLSSDKRKFHGISVKPQMWV